MSQQADRIEKKVDLLFKLVEHNQMISTAKDAKNFNFLAELYENSNKIREEYKGLCDEQTNPI